MLNNLMKKQIQQFSLFQNGYSIIKDPNNLKEILKLSDRLVEFAKPEDIKRFAEDLCVNPQVIKAIESRLRVDNRNLKKLSKCKKGTLGHAYLVHLKNSGISPESLAPPLVKDDVSYVMAHIYETHDIWHTVTGFDTTVRGELGLAAFGAAQLPSQFEYLLLAGGLLNTVFYQFNERDNRMNSIVYGWQLGKKSKPLFGVNWNELWNEPISNVRKDLKITMSRELAA
jgi:ubiquinone biosynthesis protein COQ4